LSGLLIEALRDDPHDLADVPQFAGDPRIDDDFQLALHVAYELHYRSFHDVADEWEWHPSLIAYTAALEGMFERALRADARESSASGDVGDALAHLIRGYDGPSLSTYLLEAGTLREVREFAVHRSAYQLKEADPHTWAIPRLAHGPKAALVMIQSDEYGGGVESRMHSTLFATTIQALGLDPTYGAYVDMLPGVTLATGNLVTMFGLHRRLRGALVGHLAVFEMTSVIPMARYSQALRRLGVGPAARHFYDVHVEADAHHEVVALHDLAVSLARQEPKLANEILFGAHALMDVEARFARHLLSAWQTGRTSLLGNSELASTA
jgi:hypothetical protein